MYSFNVSDCLRWKRFAAFTDWLAPTKVFQWNNWNGNVRLPCRHENTKCFPAKNYSWVNSTMRLFHLKQFAIYGIKLRLNRESSQSDYYTHFLLSSTDCLSLCTLEYFDWLSWWVAVMAVNLITHTYSTHLSETCWSSCSVHHVTITFHVICYLTVITRFVHTCPYENARLLQSC